MMQNHAENWATCQRRGATYSDVMTSSAFALDFVKLGGRSTKKDDAVAEGVGRFCSAGVARRDVPT